MYIHNLTTRTFMKCLLTKRMQFAKRYRKWKDKKKGKSHKEKETK